MERNARRKPGVRASNPGDMTYLQKPTPLLNPHTRQNKNLVDDKLKVFYRLEAMRSTIDWNGTCEILLLATPQSCDRS